MRIPPPLVALFCIGGMVIAAHGLPLKATKFVGSAQVGALCIIVGLCLVAWALAAFRRAATTLSPIRIDTASKLIVSGPFAFSRNPIYLGMAIVLTGIAALLHTIGSFVPIFIFVGYITRYQILPEERALKAKFSYSFEDYARRVRRWI